MDWEPIETAPKDIGSEAMVYSPTEGMYVAVLVEGSRYISNWWTPKFPNFAGNPTISNDIASNITHWMPLPEPPKKDT